MNSKGVLIVDDDADLRDTLTDVLEDEGYRVHTAGDGIEALEYLRASDRPCVILLDWMMPRCDGLEFRKRQRQNADIADIPVVLLTADMRLGEKGADIAAQESLQKPVQLTDLLDVVGRYCR